MVSERKRGEGIESAERGSLWAVVLAGGEGIRLRPLVRHLCGDERPKQFSPLLGARTLLGQTLDRVRRLIPPERTVVVTLQAHARYLERELGPTPRPHVLSQPESRGTAAGILLAAQWIETRDPGATLVCFPSDHLVLEEAAFMEHVAELASFVAREPGRIVLLGAPPSQPETEYGWIEPGRADRVDRPGPSPRDPAVPGEAVAGGGGSPVAPGKSLEHLRVCRAGGGVALGRA